MTDHTEPAASDIAVASRELENTSLHKRRSVHLDMQVLAELKEFYPHMKEARLCREALKLLLKQLKRKRAQIVSQQPQENSNDHHSV